MENIELIWFYFGYGESENRGMILKVVSEQTFPEDVLHPCKWLRKGLFVSTCIYLLLRLS